MTLIGQYGEALSEPVADWSIRRSRLRTSSEAVSEPEALSEPFRSEGPFGTDPWGTPHKILDQLPDILV